MNGYVFFSGMCVISVPVFMGILLIYRDCPMSIQYSRVFSVQNLQQIAGKSIHA